MGPPTQRERAAEGSHQREIFAGGAGKLLSLAERLSPRLLDLHQLLDGFDNQRTDRPRPVEAPHNLHAPVADDGGVLGTYADGRGRGSVYTRMASREGAVSLAAAAVLTIAATALTRRGRRDASADRRPRRQRCIVPWVGRRTTILGTFHSSWVTP
jgi:hypothetical protein